MSIDAWQSILSVIGGAYKERWPDEESCIIFQSTVFTYQQRITALTFLFGNLRDADMVYAALLPQIGVDLRDRDHAQRFLADLVSLNMGIPCRISASNSGERRQVLHEMAPRWAVNQARASPTTD